MRKSITYRLLQWLPAVLAALVLALPAFAGERVIVQFAPGQAGAGKQAVQAAGGQVRVDLTSRSVNAMAVELPAQAIQGLRNNPNIVHIEADPRVYPMADEVPYGISMVEADQLDDGAAGNRMVCVIDSGYHIDHIDLQSDHVSATPNSGSGDPYIDSCGHGTHVTGTIAALANDLGVVGVLPGGNVNLHIIKLFGDDSWTSGNCGYTHTSSVIAAAYDCADAGANVINMSLGGSGASSTAEQGFQDLLDQGLLSVAAAGNDGNTAYSYPASYDAVVSVAAIDSNKDLADFSQRNDQVELAAPGVNVLSTVPSVTASLQVDQTYMAEAMDRSASTTASGNLADGGLCDSSGSWSGQVVLCERGAISFSDKVANVESGGGAAAVIYNNEPGGFLGTLQCNGPSWRACSNIPAVSISQDDGQSLVAGQLGAGASVSTVTSAPADGYSSYQGTSMASPHVAGVAALVWSHDPTLTAHQIRQALQASAEDLGASGRDNSFGYGLVQAAAALDYLGLGGGDPDPNDPPTASFTQDCTDLSCSFDASASSDSDGSIASYSWDFGDGNSGSGESASHTYGNDGTYTVTLTVTDDDGDSDSTSQSVTVEAPTDPDPNDPPTASFTSDCTDLSCSFDASASSDSDGSIASYSWTFGDGNSGSGESTSHTYDADGTYTVTLTVTDDDGDSDSTSQSVTVEAPDAGGIALSGTGYKVRGRWTTDLEWSGAEGSEVDIYRDGSLLITVANSGAYTDATDIRGGGSLDYQVCEAGTSTCSETISVSF